LKPITDLKIFFKFAVLILSVIVLSTASVSLWEGKSEKVMDIPELVIRDGMTLAEFGQANGLPNPVLKKVFGLQTKTDLQKPLDAFGMSRENIRKKVEGAAALKAEEGSKNWAKILIKFASWILFLTLVFFLIRKLLVTSKTRKVIYLASVLVFGVILGSDPSAMGTVKDAITLYASKGVIFLPRMAALSIFLLMVLAANKFFCSWGCQAGVLQDLVFRFNREASDTRGILRQYKPPFAITNTFRILFLAAFSFAAVLWSVDIIEFVDPFKIYKPAAMSISVAVFVGLLLIASLFIYRPWCHLFCPFGLVGWIVEKASIFKIKVNYDTCTACEACARACPSTVMDAILKREKVIPDCFVCSTCIETCPTGSVGLAAGKRQLPPEGKFDTGEVGNKYHVLNPKSNI